MSNLSDIIQIVDIYRQIDLFRQYPINLNQDIQMYLTSFKQQEFFRPLKDSGGNPIGFISKREKVITISFVGLEGHVDRISTMLQSLDEDDFYGIQCSISSAVKSFYNDFHSELQQLLRADSNINQINLLGYSYGSMLGQFISVILEKIIAFHARNISAHGKRTVQQLYQSYKPSKMSLQDVADIESDKSLFANVTLSQACFIGPVNILEAHMLKDPDLKNLWSKIDLFVMNNDPIGNALDHKSFLGKFVSFITRSRPKILIGKIHILYSGLIIPHHNYTYYLELMHKALENPDMMKTYDFTSLPHSIPYYAFLIPYTCIDFIFSGGTLGTYSIVQLICVIAFQIYLLYLFLKILCYSIVYLR